MKDQDQASRRRLFAPLIKSLAHDLAPFSAKARAWLEDAAFEVIELVYGGWSALEAKPDFDAYLAPRARLAMIQALQANKAMTQEAFGYAIDKMARSSSNDAAVRAELSRLCLDAFPAALAKWDGRNAKIFVTSVCETAVARYVRLSWPATLPLEPKLEAMFIGLCWRIYEEAVKYMLHSPDHRDRERLVALAEWKMLKEFPSWDGKRDFGRWTKRVVINAMISELRVEKRATEQAVSPEAVQPEPVDDPLDDDGAEEPGAKSPPAGLAQPVLTALDRAFLWISRERGWVAANQYEIWQTVLKQLQQSGAGDDDDDDDDDDPDHEDTTATQPDSYRKAKQRCGKHFLPMLRRQYVITGCWYLTKTISNAVGRLFGSKGLPRFSDQDLENLERARIHLEQTKRGPAWLLELVLALLNINKADRS